MAGQDEWVRQHAIMLPAELDHCLATLDMTQADLAELLCVAPRTVRRWLQRPGTATARPVPAPVAILVRLLAAGRVNVSTVRQAGDGVIA